MKVLRNIALVFLIIGGLNWGLIGLFDFNLVAFLFDGFSVIISRIIYSIVGIAAVVAAVAWAIPDEDEEYKMKNLLIKKLEEANFIQYEISNFSLDGYSSKHNLNYWNQGQYLGFGVSASSFFAGSRYTNTNSITDYIKNINNGISTIAEKEDLDKLDMMKEYIILKLRLKDGINTDEFMSKFGNNIFNIFKTELDYLISNNLIIHNNKNLYLSSRGKEIANFVWEKFI